MDTITFWENNRNETAAKYAKAIIGSIGYIPFSMEEADPDRCFYYARLVSGKTQKED